MANRTRAQLSTDSLGFFPDNNSQLITPEDLRDWITNGIESFVTQKDTSTFENAFYEAKGNPITATSGTTNLALANGNFVHITGTGSISINSFGTLPAGSRFVLCFDIPVTLVYNATSLIIPGAANVTTAAGDCIMLISEGSGNWRVISYFPGSGLPVGTVTAVTASAPLSATPGNAPNLSIPMANGTTDGYLDKDDFVDFAGKQDALTLTTTGTSGASTLIGSTLNIPQYSGGGITALTGDVTASGTGSVTATIANGAVDIPMLSATGTPSATTFLRGDNTWATPSATGTPGGSDTQIQYNNGGAFGGVNDLTWDDVNNVLTANSPRIGQSTGNGHFHMHSINTSPPSGVTDYITVYGDKSPKQIGARFETDGYTSALQFGATSDRVYTLPDASGNVVIDSTIPSFNNGTSAGEIRLREATANGTNYIGLKAPATVAADTTFTLPNSDGTAGTVIQTNGSGVLSWVNNGGAQALQFLKNTTATPITNPTGNTILETLIIPAGTFTSNNAFLMTVRWLSTVTVTTSNWSVNINTSPAIGGVTVLGPTAVGAGNANQNGIRGFYLFGGGSGNNTRYMDSPFVSSTAATSLTTAIDWSINQYIVVWFTASANRNFQNVIISTTPI